ncbi:hypothetical protein CFIO01_07211 [Colletotrichum fioriniae PJ7]|uniref:Uncharacterized protein n=1 Tax=Colletotrichum fioriniae PJ7 TaxID=1445577 RepID=A0A010RT41_9PEZI|nr:hypothetical protein CFIO01_07211 [Colletotrichum fioriniae PJ7]
MRDDTIVAGLSVPSSARPSSAFVSLQIDSPTIIDIGNRELDGGGQLNQAQVTGLERNCPVLPCQRSSVFAPANDHHFSHPRLNIADYIPLTATRSHLDPSQTPYIPEQVNNPRMPIAKGLTFCHSSTLCRPVSPVRNHAPPPLLKQPDAPQGLPPRPSILDPRAPLLPFSVLLAPLTHRASLLTLDYPLHHWGPAFTASWSTQGLTPGLDSTASRKSIEGPPSFRSNSQSSLLRLPPSVRPLLSRLSHHQLRYPSCPCPNKSLCLLDYQVDALTEQPGTPFQAQRRTIANSSQPTCLLLNNTPDSNLL